MQIAAARIVSEMLFNMGIPQSTPRRRLLLSFLSLAGLPLGAADRKLKVIVTGGHPGDPEYGCGGTVARYADAGHDVGLLYLNHGEKNCPATPDDPASTVRTAEAEKACTLLKARPLFAAQCDGHAVVDAARYEEFRTMLESEKPDVVFTHWPVDGHRDHRAISMLTYDAWLRGGRKFALLYYEVSDGEDTFSFQPSDYVDISAVEPRKKAACYAHASQAPGKFYALQDQVARFRGLELGCARAEGFIRQVRGPAGLLP